MLLKWINHCRLCGNPHLEEVIDLGDQYSQGFLIYKDKPHPSLRKIPTKIVRCDTKKWEGGCGLVQNKVIVPPEILYSNYGYRSSVSNSMVNHLKWLNKEIVNIVYDLDNQLVCDIGCNDGTFLKEYGPNVEKLGIDPSDIARTVTGENITIINECYPHDKVSKFLNENVCREEIKSVWKRSKFRVITAIACLYDVVDINNMLLEVEKQLDSLGIFVFEVAYLPTVLNDLLYDGMVNEHISLFSLATLEWALNNCNLKCFQVQKTSVNGGSLLVFSCKKDCTTYDRDEYTNEVKRIRLEEFDAELDEQKTYQKFNERVNQHARDLKNILIKLKNDGKKIHILGASTKLNTLLGFCQIGPDLIDCAAERDERKWGGQLLNGISIVSEEESRKNVDVYLVGPYHFSQEILIREEDSVMNKNVSLLFPLPKIKIIDLTNYKDEV